MRILAALMGLLVIPATTARATLPPPPERPRLADLLRRYGVNDYAASVKVFAVKPL